MGIVYIDEAGNSGLKDPNQPNLVYGGPFIEPTNWKKVLTDIQKLEATYKSLIYTKFNMPQSMPESFDKLSGQLDFFKNFHFHATEIINGKYLWGKLNISERFQIIEDLISILKKHNVPFFAGILNKQKLLNGFKPGETMDSLGDFSTLLPLYFEYLEKQIGEKDYVVVIADGDAKEKAILHHTIQSENIQKCIPELFIYSADDNPMLQLADAGLWIIQAFHRLISSDDSDKANRIRSLYDHLQPITKLYVY